jgi:predicted methyltransferase
MQRIWIFALMLVSSVAVAQPGPPSELQQRIIEIMQSDIRTDAERARDRNRQAPQVLEFFRIEDDMRVIEIVPDAGWYTKILAPLLQDEGKLYVTHPRPTRYADVFEPASQLRELRDVEEIHWGASTARDRTAWIASGQWDVEPVDRVLTFRNYHNFDAAARAAVNKSSFDALKPGGLYGIVDHTRRHMEPDNSENMRRMDPVLVIKEVQEAGFRLLDYSTLLRRPDDELLYEVGRRSVTGNSDRFALLFVKPE